MPAPAPRPARVDAKQRAARLALGGGLAVLLLKALAWLVTDSTAILSDAAESGINVAAAGMLWISVSWAARPADREHPYGHGKAELFSAALEGALIAAAAGLIALESVRALWSGPELRQLDLGLAILVVAGVANAALGEYMIRVGRRTDSLALIADGQHLRTDVITTVGVVAGLVTARATGWLWLDPLIALGVAVHLGRVGCILVRRAVGGLLDAADEVELERLARGLEECRQPSWVDVHSMRARRAGDLLLVDLHVVVPRYYQVEELHGLGDQLEQQVLENSDLDGEIIAHFDPCRPRHCAGCEVEACPIRSAPAGKRERFTVERLRRPDDEAHETGETAVLI